jgi:dTDP-4-amino-4,6-dideoxygalactose transaminase
MGIGPGDEVIVPAFSFSGTYQPILHQNGIPVFVDIDPRTYNVDVNQIEAKITDRTKAIIPVHLHGLPADMDEVMALAEEHGLCVLEDAAQAQGALYKGKMAGTIGGMGAFSLNATKNFCGGEGGLLVTDSEELYTRAKTMRQYGETATDAPEYIRSYACSTIGYNYRTQEMPAAFARSQLRRLNEYTLVAQRNGEYLSEELGKIEGLIPPYVPPDRTHVFYKYRLRFDPKVLSLRIPAVEFRDRLLRALREEGVETTLWHTEPMPAFPVFKTLNGYGKGCPWSCPFYGKEIEYQKEDFPEAVRALETSLIVNTEPYHICVQDLEVQAAYVEAFRKVFDNLDELLA